jgi:peptidoglycan/LPS O-acetylase OafA/YrhL
VTKRATIWPDTKERQRRLIYASSAIVAVGVLLIVVGAIAGWGWTRIVGATLITVGGIVLGALVAFVEPRRQRVQTRLRAQRTTIAIIAAIILALPVVVALVAALIGLFTGSGHRSGGLLATGAIIGVFLLAATLFSTLIAIRATERASLTLREVPAVQTGGET